MIVVLLLLFAGSDGISQVKSNIGLLAGTEYSARDSIIQIGNTRLSNNGSGYLLPKANATDPQYAIAFANNDESIFYLLVNHGTQKGARQIISDVLEINRTAIRPNRKITEYCETSQGADPEIFALVKAKGNPEFYTKIIKAWRANRTTGKFELANPKKIKRCGTESFGI